MAATELNAEEVQDRVLSPEIRQVLSESIYHDDVESFANLVQENNVDVKNALVPIKQYVDDNDEYGYRAFVSLLKAAEIFDKVNIAGWLRAKIGAEQEAGFSAGMSPS